MVTQNNSTKPSLSPARRTHLLVAGIWFAVVALVHGCSRSGATESKKLSPNELISKLGTTGVNIEKNGSFNNEPPAEMNMKLKLDGQEDFVAKRFPAPKMASDYCETQKACFTVEHWSIEAFPGADKSSQWKKLLAGAGRESKHNVDAQ